MCVCVCVCVCVCLCVCVLCTNEINVICYMLEDKTENCSQHPVMTVGVKLFAITCTSTHIYMRVHSALTFMSNATHIVHHMRTHTHTHTHTQTHTHVVDHRT